MKIIISFFFLFSVCFSAQTVADIDELTLKICESLKKSATSTSDSARLQDSFNANIPQFADQFKLESFNDDLLDRIFMRLQKNCDDYQKIEKAQILNDDNSDWKLLDKKPDFKISDKTCEIFFKKYKKFFYLEANGDKTNVTVASGFWIDEFTDGTTSKLSFKNKNCKFELQFIESNNNTRKNFSVKGDQYFYEIIDIQNDVAKVIVKSNGSDGYYQFKLYGIK